MASVAGESSNVFVATCLRQNDCAARCQGIICVKPTLLLHRGATSSRGRPASGGKFHQVCPNIRDLWHLHPANRCCACARRASAQSLIKPTALVVPQHPQKQARAAMRAEVPGGSGHQAAAQALLPPVVQDIECLNLTIAQPGGAWAATGGEPHHDTIRHGNEYRAARADVMIVLRGLLNGRKPGQAGAGQNAGIRAAPARHMHDPDLRRIPRHRPADQHAHG